MANIEAIAEGIGLMLSGAQALEIKNKLDKLTKNQTKKRTNRKARSFCRCPHR